MQQSRAAFDNKGGFISPLLFNTKQPGGHKNIKPLLSKAVRLCCMRTITKPYGFRQRRLYFTAVIQHKTTERSQKHKATFVKSRAAVLCACNKAVRLSTKAAFFYRCYSTQNNREVTTNKAALSTKNAVSRARLDCTRATQPCGFRQRRLYLMALVNQKGANGHCTPTLKPVRGASLRSSKTKSLFLKQKFGPQLALLRACDNAAVAFKNVVLF